MYPLNAKDIIWTKETAETKKEQFQTEEILYLSAESRVPNLHITIGLVF